MRYYFAPMEGLTDSIYRRLHHKYFSGVDRYYMPFLSPTIHRSLTHREDRELPMADSVDFQAVPQVLTKVSDDFLWAAQVCLDRGYDEVNLNIGCPSGSRSIPLPFPLDTTVPEGQPTFRFTSSYPRSRQT